MTYPKLSIKMGNAIVTLGRWAVELRKMDLMTRDEVTTAFQADWTDWVPTMGGFATVPPNGIYRYMQMAKLVIAHIRQPTNGTADATTNFTISAPVVAKAITGGAWASHIDFINNGAYVATPGKMQIVSGEAIFRLYTDSTGAAWTASQLKRCITTTIIYEAD